MTNKKEKLINILSNIPVNMKEWLEELKSEHTEINRKDFIWHYLLRSFSTMGASRGFKGLIQNAENYNQVTFEAVKNLSNEQKQERFETVMKKAGVRYPEQKAIYLTKNYELIDKMGGLETVREKIFALKGKDSKIYFMKQFHGIGDKYARNIFMDVYYPEFHDNIAIDQRIKEITTALCYSFDNYEDHEKFYLDIASKSGLNGWELDRLLYNYKDYFLEKLL